MKSTYTLFHDPGHAWMKVPLSEVHLLGLKYEISGYSYIRKGFVYLEEDCDMSVFLTAWRNHNMVNHDPVLKSQYSEKSSRIRNYNGYNPYIETKQENQQ